MIVREQYVLLAVLRRSAGIVAQPGKAEVGAEPVEQCERFCRGKGDVK